MPQAPRRSSRRQFSDNATVGYGSIDEEAGQERQEKQEAEDERDEAGLEEMEEEEAQSGDDGEQGSDPGKCW